MSVHPDFGRRVLIVLHEKDSSPGRLGRLLRARGYKFDCRRPCFDEPLPKSLKDYAGVIVFGGSMSANDQDAWLRREIDWIGVPLKEGTPFIGICLGAQMLARHLGYRVQPHAQGRVSYRRMLVTQGIRRQRLELAI
jgi:GMP synthase (glutamine-hydrolysing)